MARHNGRAPQTELFRYGLLALLALSLLASAFAAGGATVWFLAPQVRQTQAAPEPTTAAGSVVATEARREELASLLWETWDILENEYLEPEVLVPEDMIRGAAAGAVLSVDDPYTVLVDPLPAAIMDQDMQGSFEGIGATVAMVDGRLTIQDFIPGSPASKAGLRHGDVILQVDGGPVDGLDIVSAISLIRGPRGSVVRLLVERVTRTEPFEVSVTRERVELLTVESRMLDNDVAYLRLTEFNAVAARKVRTALRQLLAKHPQGLILDLRDNPGGYFQTAIDVASEFLHKGDIIVSERERDQEADVFPVTRAGLATEIPLVVLVNRGSASASEIVAGAIRDHARGLLVGETTYGKGSVQNVHTLSDGSSLRVTVARYYLPDGENIDGTGLVPDVEVLYTQEDADAQRDPQLERAVELLTSVEGD